MSKPQNKVRIKWTPEFAYAIGLITTDGNLSPDGRHFDFTSKDLEQIENLKKCLDIKNKISQKTAGHKKTTTARIQFGDVNFYRFLLGIGLMPNKSKTLAAIEISNQYFWDFLRGHFDGDGTFYSYWDPRWKSSFMFYLEFLSASKEHVDWLRSQLKKFLDIEGHITRGAESSTWQLKYAKADSIKLLPKIYYTKSAVCLSRKYLKIKKALATIGKQNII